MASWPARFDARCFKIHQLEITLISPLIPPHRPTYHKSSPNRSCVADESTPAPSSSAQVAQRQGGASHVAGSHFRLRHRAPCCAATALRSPQARSRDRCTSPWRLPAQALCARICSDMMSDKSVHRGTSVGGGDGDERAAHEGSDEGPAAGGRARARGCASSARPAAPGSRGAAHRWRRRARGCCQRSRRMRPARTGRAGCAGLGARDTRGVLTARSTWRRAAA